MNKPNTPNIKIIPLGKTEIQISPLGTGTWQWGDSKYWGYGSTYQEADVQEAFQASLKAGVSFFDTAERYGQGKSEKLLGKFIHANSQTVVSIFSGLVENRPATRLRGWIATCQRGTISGKRDQAILLALLDTGLRATELTSLNLDSLNLGTGAITVEKGNGGKSRTVFIGRRSRKAIRAYLRERNDNSPALFVARTRERMGYDILRSVLTRRATLAGITYPSPHAFRRAYALNMFRNGVDIYCLQKLMGHAGIRVFQRYLAISESDTRL